VQFSDYETEFGLLAVEIVLGKHFDFSTYLAKSSRAQSGAAQRCSFLIMEKCFGPLAVEIFQGKHCDFSTNLAKRGRAHSGACAEVQIPDY
jgi:hypothetical protein